MTHRLSRTRISQVKKRAVLDLLGGMRKQGLQYAKSSAPSQTTDMLQVMSLAQPFSGDRLAGMGRAWLFAGHGKCVVGDGVAWDMLERGERYYVRGVSELSRLRLEAGAPVSRDVTRREAEVKCVFTVLEVMFGLEYVVASFLSRLHWILSLPSDRLLLTLLPFFRRLAVCYKFEPAPCKSRS